MNPAQLLALTRPAAQPDTAAAGTPPPASRNYRAFEAGSANEGFLTFHSVEGHFQALPYSGLQFIGGDGRGHIGLQLIFTRMLVTVQGRQLAPVFESIRTRSCAHLHEFNGGRYDPPEPGAAVITGLVFGVERAELKVADK